MQNAKAFSPPLQIIEIIYDGECPLCRSYVTMLALREACETLILTDARQSEEARKLAKQHGMLLDEGFIVRIDAQLYHGAEAMHQLTKLIPKRGCFNRLNGLGFASMQRAKRLYPILMRGRLLLLRLLGKPTIDADNNSKNG
jgi:predicted DCC family thiol-disulfide oxidoreductase YuxK